MPKSTVVAAADAVIFQCIIYDSKSRKRAIAVYMCGDDVFWADNVFSLFDRDKTRPAPSWLKKQLSELGPESRIVHLDFRGQRLVGNTVLPTHEDLQPNVRVPEGESLDDEDAIPQARG